MRITAILEQAIPLTGNIANAVVNFTQHTVSLVALVSDQRRAGRPVIGLAFNSIGRFAQSGILRERMLPRLLAADPASLLSDDGTRLNPAAVLAAAMADEKPGGHGDRAGAAAALELAAWDLNAKLGDEPAYIHIAKQLGRAVTDTGSAVYAAGGYYYATDSDSQDPCATTKRLHDELSSYQDAGYTAFKIKIGGAALHVDCARVETAIEIAGAGSAVAVDANGRFNLTDAQRYAKALIPYALRWYEEPGDPLDFDLQARLAATYPGAMATGENLFSAADARNLLRFAGLRPQHDILQMDPGLSYGLTEYLRMLEFAQQAGFSRAQCIPHGGHLINLHIVAALSLGGCEAYPGVFQPFGGFAPACRVADGRVWPSDAPGFGLEQKPELQPHIKNLMGAR